MSRIRLYIDADINVLASWLRVELSRGIELPVSTLFAQGGRAGEVILGSSASPPTIEAGDGEIIIRVGGRFNEESKPTLMSDGDVVLLGRSRLIAHLLTIHLRALGTERAELEFERFGDELPHLAEIENRVLERWPGTHSPDPGGPVSAASAGGRPPNNGERDREIHALYRAGVPQKELAQMAGLGRERIKQIVREQNG